MKKLYPIFSVLFVLALALSACAPAAPAVAPVVEQPAVEQPAAEQPAAPPPVTEAPVVEEPAAEPLAPPTTLTLATTTSTYDSGLLDYILPDFESKFNAKVDIIAVGTGQAMELGKNGDADVLLVHARAKEDEFMANGDGVRREDVMYNDFVLVGPASDPAGVKEKGKAVGAFKAIESSGQTFISRGDESGTHVKEKAVWKEAGIEPKGDWYVSAGQGMGDVLMMANEQLAYTLSDRATYLAFKLKGLDLEILFEGDPVLFNPYGVISVNPDKNPNIKFDLGTQFIDWIISVDTQEMISQFGVAEFGAPLFVADSDLWKAHLGEAVNDPEGDFVITGLVKNPMGWTEDEIRAMDTTDVVGKNKDDQDETYKGVLVTTLLKMAEPLPEAKTFVLVADDGFTAELDLAEVLACPDCILSFRNNGGFSAVFPGFPKKAQTKGVVKIEIK